MHVDLVFGLALAFAEVELCFRPLSSTSCPLDGLATGAASSSDRPGGASLLSRRENTPI